MKNKIIKIEKLKDKTKMVKRKRWLSKSKKEGIEQVEGYLELDKVKNIPEHRSFLLIGSKDGVEFLEVWGLEIKFS